MKSLATFALIALGSATLASAAPELSVEQALKIAKGYMKEYGRDTWISSITLAPISMGQSTQVWAIKWGSPVLIDDTKRETGIEIAMDGSYSRYTERLANTKTPGEVGIPAHRAELSNHRTRSRKPSVLDMKH